MPGGRLPVAVHGLPDGIGGNAKGEGGGALTGRVIPDGIMNNVFEDISDLDRALGR
jgi:hypothetical protein